jgi:uncharacterized YccA/Bax inhibitor family protein
MANPVFNDETIKNAPKADGAGWGAPTAGTHVATRPVTDGPVSGWQRAMTVNGTISASAVLIVLLLVAGTFGWRAAEGPTITTSDGVVQDTYQFPAIAFLGIIIGFAAVIAANFKPKLAKFLGPVYALGYGFAVGAISKGYETLYDGIVVQAVLATVSVLAVMLVLYRTRIIKVTNKFRRIVVFATLGVMVLYMFSWIISLFGTTLPFLNGDNMAMSIGFSVLVCGLAAANLALDFDFIERGTAAGLSKDYEWVAALGLVVTLVWLYLELLRLLSYLRQ